MDLPALSGGVPDCQGGGPSDRSSPTRAHTRRTTTGPPGCSLPPSPLRLLCLAAWLSHGSSCFVLPAATLAGTHLLGPERGTTASTFSPTHDDLGPKDKVRPRGRLELLLLRGGHRGAPPMVRLVFCLASPPATSSRLVEHAELTQRVEAGVGATKARGWLDRKGGGTGRVLMSAQMGQPVSLGHGEAKAPWKRGGQQHPEGVSTG